MDTVCEPGQLQGNPSCVRLGKGSDEGSQQVNSTGALCLQCLCRLDLEPQSPWWHLPKLYKKKEKISRYQIVFDDHRTLIGNDE